MLIHCMLLHPLFSHSYMFLGSVIDISTRLSFHREMNGGARTSEKSIYHLGEASLEPGPSISTDYTSAFASTSTPIVLDNGSSRFRAGWASEHARGPRIDVENIVAKYRDRKTNKNIALAGAQIYCDTLAKQTAKSPFEGDVVCNFDAMETMLDYAFTTLGIDGSEAIGHPIAMSEIVCNPASSRARMCLQPHIKIRELF